MDSETEMRSRGSLYPVVVVPQNLKDLASGVLPNPELTLYPTKPVQPLKPKFDSILLLLPVLGLVFFKIHIIASLIPFLLFVLSIWDYISKSNEYPAKMTKYLFNEKRYQAKVEEFTLKKEYHDFFWENINDDDFKEKEKQRHITQILHNTVKPSILVSNKKGASEMRFKAYLENIFGDQVHTNRAIEIFDQEINKDEMFSFESYNNCYVPDLILIHKQSNMHIDIEIDEPYTFDGTPIHIYGNNHDERRNDYFNKNGWIVIRFAEEQVVRWPKECCFFIARVIAKYTKDESYLNKLGAESQRMYYIRWTEEEALTLFNKQYRNSYLK